MPHDAEFNRNLSDAFRVGERNQEVIRLAENWCRNIEIERSRFSGVGIPEQMTGLPISPREFSCRYAKASRGGMMNAEAAALSFYDENCVGCEHRVPGDLPNLLTLVQARDDAVAAKNAADAAAAKAAEDAFRARELRRANVASDSDEVQRGLIDIMGELDADSNSENARRLTEAAKAAPTCFSDEMRTLLYDLVESGSMSKAEGALGALEATESDADRLAAAIASSVRRGVVGRFGVEMLEERMGLLSPEQLQGTISTLMWAAAPVSYSFPVSPSAPGPNPKPLVAAYQAHPDTIVDEVVRSLRGGSSSRRRIASSAADILMSVDDSLVGKFTPDLIRAVLLPDDDINASARAAAEDALVTALTLKPEEWDQQLRRVLENSTKHDRALLFGIVERPLRLARRGDIASEAVQVCVQHAVEALTVPEEVERLREAANVIDYAAASHPEVVASCVEQLIGAAALLAERIESEPLDTKLEDPTPPELRHTEAISRRKGQYNELRKIVETTANLAPQFPNEVGTVFISLFEQLGDEHERLIEALMKGVGQMGRQSEGLAMALPKLYVGLMHQSTLVRAAAAEAYGKIVKGSGDDLPDLVHDAFLLLLQDPYVIVHTSAVRALRSAKPPARFNTRIRTAVASIVFIYEQSHSDDTFLSDALEVLYYQTDQESRTPQFLAALVRVLRDMNPNDAWDAFRWLRHALIDAPEVGELVLDLITNDETYPFTLDSIAESVHDLPALEISRVAEKIPNAARVARSFSEGDPSMDLLGALTGVGEWTYALEVVDDWLADAEVSPWPEQADRVRVLRAAVNVEAALATGDSHLLKEALDSWSESGG